MEVYEAMDVGLVYRNITVAGDSLAGGGDFFVVHLLRIMKDQGYRVILATTSQTNWNAVQRVFDRTAKPDVEVRSSFFPRIGGFRLYRDLIPSAAIERIKKITDITFNAYGDDPFWNTDIIYMHTPITREEIQERYGRSRFARMYFGLYRSISKRLAQRLTTRILTNSNFSRMCIRDLLSLDSRVLYPPVDVDEYKVLVKNKNREKKVVTVGRFSQEKNWELIPIIAKKVKDTHFHLIGTHVGNQSEMILRKIDKSSRELGVRDRIHIHLNLSTRNKLEVLSRCRVYLHARQREYFGMSIVEAMAAGIAPVVHNSGGPVEIVGDRDFLYDNLDEASAKVEQWLETWSVRNSEELSERSERFGLTRFANDIVDVLEELN